jgi:3-(methylthio)propionyl---CoA ligase
MTVEERNAAALPGLMMDTPLLIGSLIDHAVRFHGDREIVTHRSGQPDHRYTYRDARERSAQVAHALRTRLGIVPGDRIATLAWNSYRHFELYFGVSGIGAVLHTVNPRLFAQQLEYIINHAADRYIFVDVDLVPILEALAPRLPNVEGYVVLTDAASMPATSLPNAIAYETLLEGMDREIVWPQLDERSASSLCYTSGTTGNPKGVLYSHRSTLLHTFAAALSLSTGPRTLDAILPVVPMFHANAWGLPYVAAMVGSKFVCCDPHLDPAQLYDSLEREAITMTCGVPTIWLRMLDYLQTTGKRLTTVETLACGGSAPPPSLIAAFEAFGITFLNAWGMTESSPVCTSGKPRPEHDVMPQRIDYKTRAGRCIFGVEMRLVDDEEQPLPMDGTAQGELLIRGPWIAAGYYNDDVATEAGTTPDGWLRTGDIATVDEHGYTTIRDRSKDVIKSGGEWISSVDLENAAVAHPGVVEAAAVGVPHPTWSERPVLVVVPKPGASVDRDDMLAFLDGKIPKWWMPDDVVIVDELPHTATGKISKRTLREQLAAKG